MEVELIEAEIRRFRLRVISVDRPGMGESSFQPRRQILDWPKDVEFLADKLGGRGRRFGILAMSGGVPYACACAVQIPERLTHVALVSGLSPMNEPGVEDGSQDSLISMGAKFPLLTRLGVHRIRKLANHRPAKAVEKVASMWTENERRLFEENDDLRRRFVANLRLVSQCGSRGAAYDLCLAGRDWGFQPGDVKHVPVSIWVGAKDQVAPVGKSLYLHRNMNHSTLTIGQDAGHVSMLRDYAPQILMKF